MNVTIARVRQNVIFTATALLLSHPTLFRSIEEWG